MTPPETFDARWLALREPMDHRSRSADLAGRLAAEALDRGWRRILDLGCGTGSNIRFLAPRLGPAMRWTAIDRDPALLARLERGVPAGTRVETREGDLASQAPAAIAGTDIVTASALLDLVSRAWIDRLVEACRAAGAAALIAQSYDGEIDWGGAADPDDATVTAAVNRHQTRDKGLGPALGPAAGRVAAERFAAAGYRTTIEQRPWRLDGSDAPLARALVDGWMRAATEEHPEHAAAIREWASRRRAAIDRGAFELVVGHVDLLALPASA